MTPRILVAALLLALGGACASAAPVDGANATFPDVAYASVASQGGALHVDVRTSPSQPPPRGTCTVELSVTDPSGAPQDGLSVDVVPWMVSHGHGTSTRPTVLARGGGKYVVSDVNMFMPGTWELRVSFSGRVTDHATPTVEVP